MDQIIFAKTVLAVFVFLIPSYFLITSILRCSHPSGHPSHPVRLLAPTGALREAAPPKNGIFYEIFLRGAGGGTFSNPKTFVNLPSYFWYAKIILSCQNMFYKSGEVISDQFHHLIWISVLGRSSPVPQSFLFSAFFPEFSRFQIKIR